MKPLKHARISAKRYGHDWQHWYPLHDWFDKTKAAYPKMQHRAFLHNEVGIELAVRVFPNSPEARQIGEDHVVEDLGHVVTVAEWLEQLNDTDLEQASRRSIGRFNRTEQARREAPAEDFATRYGGLPGNYQPLLDFFHRPMMAAAGDPKARWLWFNSFGIYLVEDEFGPVVALPDGELVSTRQIGEEYVRLTMGFIPAMGDVASRIRLKDWMLGTGVRDGLRLRKQSELAEIE